MKIKPRGLKGILLPVIIILSVYVSAFTSGQFTLESGLPIESEYRLKFVDSVDINIGVIDSETAILPVNIIEMKEENDWIEIKTYENSVIYAPVTATVLESSQEGIVTLSNGSIKVELMNIITGTKAGEKIECGAVIGSVDGEWLKVKVFYKNRRLTLEELKNLL